MSTTRALAPWQSMAAADARERAGEAHELAAKNLWDDDWRLLLNAEEDTGSLGLLFERHRDFVFRVAWGVSGSDQAEDVTQEVFLRVARGRHRFRPRGKFTTLLYRITLNTARELSRRTAREVLGDAPERPETPAPVHEVLSEDPLPALRKALESLPERQREVVVLRYLEGLSTREAARAMGCRSGTVKAHLHRAMSALRSHFAQRRSQAQRTDEPISRS